MSARMKTIEETRRSSFETWETIEAARDSKSWRDGDGYEPKPKSKRSTSFYRSRSSNSLLLLVSSLFARMHAVS